MPLRQGGGGARSLARGPQGELVSLIGANGAGKTTTLKAISGVLAPSAGRIVFDGEDITRASARRVLELGIAHCPEGRRVFPYMTVRENLEMGCYLRRDKAGIEADLDRLYERFPILHERRAQAAGTLSGGEQQMLAISRALMSRPQARPVRRAVAGPCAQRRRAHLRHHPADPRRGRDGDHGRAECAAPRWNSRIDPTCSSRAASASPARAGRCSTTRTSRRPISAARLDASVFQR